MTDLDRLLRQGTALPDHPDPVAAVAAAVRQDARGRRLRFAAAGAAGAAVLLLGGLAVATGRQTTTDRLLAGPAAPLACPPVYAAPTGTSTGRLVPDGATSFTVCVYDPPVDVSKRAQPHGRLVQTRPVPAQDTRPVRSALAALEPVEGDDYCERRIQPRVLLLAGYADAPPVPVALTSRCGLLLDAGSFVAAFPQGTSLGRLLALRGPLGAAYVSCLEGGHPDAPEYVGLQEDEAAQLARRRGQQLRVVGIDDECQVSTADLRTDRVSVELVDGRVADATIS